MATTKRAYESNTNKYVYNVKPAVQVETKQVGLSGSDKKRIIISMIIIGMIFILSIILQAFAANVAFQNSELRKSNDVLISDIETLKIEIQSSNNIGIIEDKATKKLGMVHPEGASLVDVEASKEASKKLATGLKNRAFN
ncbi:MAG: hypothetical protein RSA49_05345 [Anaerovoracaceae bacterium]